MGFRVGHIAQLNSFARFFAPIAIFSFAFALVISNLGYATDSAINVGVSGSPAPSLYISNPSSPVNVTSMPLNVDGVVNNLTQVQVYVDGAYSLTIPLTVTSEDFSYSLNLNEGDHSVKFVGISAYTSENPEVTITVSYKLPVVEPPNPPNNGSGGGKTPSQPGSSDNGGVVIGGAPIDSTDGSGMAGVVMPQWLYRSLVFFDIINPNKVTDTGTMFGRFVLLLVALFLIIFARPTLWLYRYLRYDVLRLNKRPLTYILRRYPLFWIRSIGVVIAALVFIYL